MGNVANGYPNHQWYYHMNIVKDAQLEDVIYEGEYGVL